MTNDPSIGTCTFCLASFSKSTMTRHLKACPKRTELRKPAEGTRAARAGRVLHLVVQGKWNPSYWLHLEMDGAATFELLDDFLRRLWLECCEHGSAFRSRRRVTWDEVLNATRGELPMDAPLGRYLTRDAPLDYDYDFGSTTSLTVKLASERTGGLRKNEVVLLARNAAPDIRCACGAPAKWVIGLGYGPAGWLCEACGKGHEDEDELLLPVLNSPRTGVCAYSG